MIIKEWWGVDWLHVAQDMIQLLPFVNTVMTFRFHKMRGIA
jgi:hypothetical protein